MKACFIKQPYINALTLGSTKYGDETPASLLDKFMYRSQNYGMITGLEMDIYVVGMVKKTATVNWMMQKEPESYQAFLDAHSPMPLENVPIDMYDLVVTYDRFIPEDIIRANPGTLFAYYEQEHTSTGYKESLQMPQEGYDLFLDHFLSSPWGFEKLPASISFPYLVDKNAVRSAVNIDSKENAVFLDTHLARTIGFTDGSENFSLENLQKYADWLGGNLGMNVLYAPPFNDYSKCLYLSATGKLLKAGLFLKLLARSRFFPLCRGGLALGQGLPEAAMMGNVVIADDAMRYSKLLCHPKCLLKSHPWSYNYYLGDIPAQRKAFETIIEIKDDPGLIREILDYQDRQLDTNFLSKPIAALEKAVAMKKGG